MPPVHLLSRLPGDVTRYSDALILRSALSNSRPFAGSGLFQLAQVDLLRLRYPYMNVFAARNLPEEGGRLAQRCLHVEVVEAGDAITGNYNVEPPHGGTGRRVMDTDVGDRATDDERIHVP